MASNFCQQCIYYIKGLYFISIQIQNISSITEYITITKYTTYAWMLNSAKFYSDSVLFIRSIEC